MKKGFTLVELLAVIVILGIILVISVPIINDLVDESEKKTFLSDAQTIYRTALTFSVDDITNDGVIYSSSGNSLDLSKKGFSYCIKINSSGDVTSIIVSDGIYIVTGDGNFLSLDFSSVIKGNMNSYVCE